MGGTPMTQAAAQAKLEAEGIYASSTGGCTDRTNRNCTSYEGILSDTVDKVIALKKASGCEIVITGGTESGPHASGTYSHANGYKVDIRRNPMLDAYIEGFKKIQNRSDGPNGGYEQWKSPDGDIYCLEGNHWDIKYF